MRLFSFLNFFVKEEHLMLENRFKTNLINDIEYMFPGCIVLHLDPNDIQGMPDLLILYKDKWAALEGKKDRNAPHRPNQDYYVGIMNEMSYASFIYPENKEGVLDELQQAFRYRRSTRFSKR
jgi:hypothetical protein